MELRDDHCEMICYYIKHLIKSFIVLLRHIIKYPAGFRCADSIESETQEMVILTQDPNTGELTQEIINSVPDGSGELTQETKEEQYEVLPQQVELTDQQLVPTHIVLVCLPYQLSSM